MTYLRIFIAHDYGGPTRRTHGVQWLVGRGVYFELVGRCGRCEGQLRLRKDSCSREPRALECEGAPNGLGCGACIPLHYKETITLGHEVDEVPDFDQERCER